MKKLLQKFFGALAIACTFGAPVSAHAKSADQLACLFQGMTDDQYIAYGEILTVKDKSKRTQPEPSFMYLGMAMGMCANQYGWSDNERNNSTAYAIAYPMMKGMRLLGDAQGYAALDRYYAAHTDGYKNKGKFDAKSFDAMIDAAIVDGLKLSDDTSARENAAHYLDTLYATARYRRGFETNRFEMP